MEGAISYKVLPLNFKVVPGIAISLGQTVGFQQNPERPQKQLNVYSRNPIKCHFDFIKVLRH
jgi:hypothetical protein